MTFFYDLNKKLSDLAARQTLNEGKAAKPDFLDLDKDGNKTEPMKKAAKEKKVEESMDEGSTGDYSAKKARAGKDIGKPGKNFAKIAKSAAERYGSKERGEKVAGAVLAKLRKEDVEEGVYKATPDKSQVPAVQRKAQGPDWKMKLQDLEKEKTNSPTSSAGLARRKQELGMNESIKLIAVKEGADYTAKVYRDTAYDEFHVRVFNKGQEVVESRYFTESQDDAVATADYMVEGAFTMAPKQNFADKIAGAKKEVDEMLGDVAAEAMKNALLGRQQVADEGNAFTGKLKSTPKGGKFKLGDKEYTDTSGLDEEEKEDLNPFTNWKKPRAEKHKAGDVEHGSKHDIKHTATGRIVTRRVDPNTGHSVGSDDDKPADGEKRKRGRPSGKGAGKSIGAKGPSGKSKLMTKEAGHDNSELAHAKALLKKAGYKIEKAEEELDEKAVSKQQQKFMGMAHAIQKGEKVKGASPELKKVAKTMKKKDVEDFASTKHKGLPQKAKAKKEEAVEENTVAGSVAPAVGNKAPKGAGGMSFGKGVYEAKLAESFDNKLNAVLNEGMSVNMSADQDGKKSLTVTATDDDAVKLSQLLNLAGIGGQSEGYSEVCPGCGSSDCGCDEMHEDLANSAENTEYADTNYMINSLSGGLDGMKSTGQTTVPVVNRDPRRGAIGPLDESNDVVELYKRIA